MQFTGALSDVHRVLEAQRCAWNAGDVAAFMEGYEASDETTFISGGVLKRGFTTLLHDYATRYASREAMGTLAFEELELRELSDAVALALGRFVLTPHGEGAAPNSGRFTLVLRRGAHGWRITHDHTG
jgi:ketosteroid isomerase-like protein